MEKTAQQIKTFSDQMNELGISIQNKLRPLSPISECCIYKIPTFNRKGNENFYRPSVISIGPVYHKNKTPELETMQELKWIYLQCFLSHPKNAHQHNLLPFINNVGQREQEIRECYQQNIGLESEEFIEMIVLDAAFIIYLLVRYTNDASLDDGGYTLEIEHYQENLLPYVDLDLFMLENQIPFFVLKDIFDIAFGKMYPNVSLIDLTCNYMKSTNIPGGEIFVVSEDVTTELLSAKHLLDFWRMLCCLNFDKPGNRDTLEGDVYELPKTAKQLRAAGVKLKASESKNPLEVTFKNGVLEIPIIVINDVVTEGALRNIRFFEQCHCMGDTFFLDYTLFLDRLIDSVEDVQILTEKGILNNHSGSDVEVLDVFNKMNKHSTFTYCNFYYSNLSREVNAYAGFPMNQWKATLRRRYFNNPWAIISVIAAIVLFVLTLLQTITGFNSK